MPQERIQKILARMGIASRRKAEELITEGAVTINGKPARLGDKAEFGQDAIKVSGKLIHGEARPPVYVAFNKPRGVISMFADPEGRATLTEFFSRFGERLFPVGRLDFMSEGLLLLTNDGEFAEKVQKSDAIPRVYRVKIKGRPDPAAVDKLSRPTRLEGKLVHPHSVRVTEHLASKSLVEVVLIGGGAIDLKALFERNGILVDKITRTAIGQVTLRELAPGDFRLLRKSQADAIFNHPELAVRQIEQAQEKSESPSFLAGDEASGQTAGAKARIGGPAKTQRWRDSRGAGRGAGGYGHGGKRSGGFRPAHRDSEDGAERPRSFRPARRNSETSAERPSFRGPKPVARSGSGEFSQRGPRSERREERAPRSFGGPRDGYRGSRDSRDEARPSRAPYGKPLAKAFGERTNTESRGSAYGKYREKSFGEAREREGSHEGSHKGAYGGGRTKPYGSFRKKSAGEAKSRGPRPRK